MDEAGVRPCVGAFAIDMVDRQDFRAVQGIEVHGLQAELAYPAVAGIDEVFTYCGCDALVAEWLG